MGRPLIPMEVRLKNYMEKEGLTKIPLCPYCNSNELLFNGYHFSRSCERRECKRKYRSEIQHKVIERERSEGYYRGKVNSRIQVEKGVHPFQNISPELRSKISSLAGKSRARNHGTPIQNWTHEQRIEYAKKATETKDKNGTCYLKNMTREDRLKAADARAKSGSFSSKAEIECFTYLKENFDPDLIPQYSISKIEVPHHYDMYSPKYNCLIEFDGVYWHGSEGAKIHDNKLVHLALDKGYLIYRIKDKEWYSSRTEVINDMLRYIRSKEMKS